MKKALIAALLLIAGSAVAQQTVTEATSDLTGLGMESSVAAEIASILNGKADSSGNTLITSASSKEIRFSPGNDANRLVKIFATSDTAHHLAFGDGTTSAQNLAIHSSSADGADDGYLIIGPGGANSLERGAAIVMYGNESTSNAGTLKLDCGNVANAVVEVITPQGLGSDSSDYKVRWYWPRGSGNLYADATNGGNIVMQKSGTGLQLMGGAAYDGWSFVTTECSLVNGTGGTTQTWSNALPAYAVMLALSGYVVSEYTSGGAITELDVGNGTTANQYADALALAVGTTWRSPETGAAGGTMPQANAAAAQNIVVTANGGGNILTGSMRLCITYLRNQAPTS